MWQASARPICIGELSRCVAILRPESSFTTTARGPLPRIREHHVALAEATHGDHVAVEDVALRRRAVLEQVEHAGAAGGLLTFLPVPAAASLLPGQPLHLAGHGAIGPLHQGRLAPELASTDLGVGL